MAKKANKNELAISQNDININDLKAELVEYMKKEIDIEIDDVVKEKERKYIRAKSRKIFWLEIIIFLLILIIIGGIVFLYKDHYFDKYFNVANNVIVKDDNKEDTTKEVEPQEEPKEEPKEEKPTLEELKKKYENILDNINITDKNSYLRDFYKNNYTDELKLSMSASLIEEDNLKEDESFIIKRETIESNYKKLFSSNINIVSFDYNGVHFNYIKSLDTFIGSGNLEESNKITKDITSIEENEDIIKITTKEYYTKDDKKYNPLTNKEKEEEKVYEFKLVEGKYLINE